MSRTTRRASSEVSSRLTIELDIHTRNELKQVRRDFFIELDRHGGFTVVLIDAVSYSPYRNVSCIQYLGRRQLPKSPGTDLTTSKLAVVASYLLLLAFLCSLYHRHVVANIRSSSNSAGGRIRSYSNFDNRTNDRTGSFVGNR